MKPIATDIQVAQFLQLRDRALGINVHRLQKYSGVRFRSFPRPRSPTNCTPCTDRQPGSEPPSRSIPSLSCCARPHLGTRRRQPLALRTHSSFEATEPSPPPNLPEWPQPAQPGGSYKVDIIGEPSYTVDICPTSRKGDHNYAAIATGAGRVVNAIPAVVAAPPGIRTTLDLPLITGKGLFYAN